MVIVMMKHLAIAVLLPLMAYAQALTAPTAPYPANGATEVDLLLLLSWTQSGTVDATSVYFGTQPDPPFRVGGRGLLKSFLPTGSVPSLVPAATYYWRVEVTRGAETVSSPRWSFTTASIGPTGLGFVPVTPCRLVDTREDRGNFGKPFLAAGSTRTFELGSPQASCGIPTSALAYSLNVTVVPKGPLGYLSI